MTEPKKPYAEKLRDPRWQKKKCEAMMRDQFRCQDCGGTRETLNVHHLKYAPSRDPWDSPLEDLLTLCERCHKKRHPEKALTHTDRRVLSLILRERLHAHGIVTERFETKDGEVCDITDQVTEEGHMWVHQALAAINVEERPFWDSVYTISESGFLDDYGCGNGAPTGDYIWYTLSKPGVQLAKDGKFLWMTDGVPSLSWTQKRDVPVHKYVPSEDRGDIDF